MPISGDTYFLPPYPEQSDAEKAETEVIRAKRRQALKLMCELPMHKSRMAWWHIFGTPKSAIAEYPNPEDPENKKTLAWVSRFGDPTVPYTRENAGGEAVLHTKDLHRIGDNWVTVGKPNRWAFARDNDITYDPLMTAHYYERVFTKEQQHKFVDDILETLELIAETEAQRN